MVRGDAENFVSPTEIAAKFASLGADTLGEAGAREVIDIVGRVEDLKDLRELTALLGRARA